MRFINHTKRAASASQGSIDAEKLYGIDSGDGSASRADSVSAYDGRPGVINMIKNRNGAVVKRPGYTLSSQTAASSVHIYRSYDGDVYFYLNGNTMTWIKNDMTHQYTVSFSLDNCRSLQWDTYMFFLSGDGIIIADIKHETFAHWSSTDCGGGLAEAYLPTIYIGCTPDGAGAAYEPVNLLCERVAEQFAGNGTAKEFFTHLAGTNFEAYIKQKDGSWKKTEISTVTHRSAELVSAPPKPDVTGEDNVRIVYSLPDFRVNVGAIASCTCATSFGVDGHRDRVFLSGNKTYPGRVYFSHMDKPLYFADIDYIKVGDSETDVYALIREGDSLAVVTDDSIYMVKGGAGEQLAVVHDALFAVTDIFSTPEPIGSTPPVIFMGEPVYITREGVCAITPSGILDERCADIRSERINAHFTREDMSAIEMTVWDNKLVLSNKKDRLYILDGDHYTVNGRSKRYEGYIWQDICARSVWTDAGALFFTDGNSIFCFSDSALCDERSYGVQYPIECCWETPYLYPADFKDVKFFTRLGLLTDSTVGMSDVKILARFDTDEWRTVCDYSGDLSVFCYGSIDFGSFTYRPSVKSYSKTVRLLHKRCRGIKLRFENNKKDRSLSLVRLGAEYIKM